MSAPKLFPTPPGGPSPLTVYASAPTPAPVTLPVDSPIKSFLKKIMRERIDTMVEMKKCASAHAVYWIDIFNYVYVHCNEILWNRYANYYKEHSDVIFVACICSAIANGS